MLGWLVEEQTLVDIGMHYLILCWLQEIDLPETLQSLLSSSGYSWSQNAVEEKKKKKKKKRLIYGYKSLRSCDHYISLHHFTQLSDLLFFYCSALEQP